MKCPSCEQGIIGKVRLKGTGRLAYLCDFCETVWLEGESISSQTGHPFRTYSQTGDLEYTVEDVSFRGQDYDPVHFTRHK